MLRLAVLVSGSGSNLEAIIKARKIGDIKSSPEIVISNRKAAYALERAEQAGIKGIYIGKRNYPDFQIRQKKLLTTLMEHNIDLIVLAGYLAILDKELIKTYHNRIINIHPSLLPAFGGMGCYGIHVHEKVLQRGVKVSGATVHVVDAGVDTGKILLQEAVTVLETDTPQSLQKRVLEVEHRLLPHAIKLLEEEKINL